MAGGLTWLWFAGAASSDPLHRVPAAGASRLRARRRGGRGAGRVARHRQRRRRLRVLLLRRQAPPLVAQPPDGVLRPRPHMVRASRLACVLHSSLQQVEIFDLEMQTSACFGDKRFIFLPLPCRLFEQDGPRRRVGAAGPRRAAQQEAQAGGVRGGAAPPVPLHRRRPLLRARALLRRILRLRQRRRAGGAPRAAARVGVAAHASTSTAARRALAA